MGLGRPPGRAASLRLRTVTRHREVGRERVAVLNGVSLDAEPGQVIAILGPHGSGKTTLLRIGAGVERPDAGTVSVDGEEIGRLPASERTRCLRRVGYVPKEWLVARGRPVLDHVALPLLASGRPVVTALAKAHEALERVGVAECAYAATHELSADEQTRVALAQALVAEPLLLLADEPGVTAEPQEREAVLRLLRTVAAERESLALVLTTRDVAGTAGAECVLTLGDGRLRNARRQADADVVPFRARSSAHVERLP